MTIEQRKRQVIREIRSANRMLVAMIRELLAGRLANARRLAKLIDMTLVTAICHWSEGDALEMDEDICRWMRKHMRDVDNLIRILMEEQ